MAVYTSDQLAKMRQAMSKLGTATWVKVDINAAVQAVEDLMLGQGKTAIFSAIEAASPGVFTNAQKVLIFRVWVERRFGQDRGN